MSTNTKSHLGRCNSLTRKPCTVYRHESKIAFSDFRSYGDGRLSRLTNNQDDNDRRCCHRRPLLRPVLLIVQTQMIISTKLIDDVDDMKLNQTLTAHARIRRPGVFLATATGRWCTASRRTATGHSWLEGMEGCLSEKSVGGVFRWWKTRTRAALR